ncbi:MAG: hypothetical protein ACTSSP_03565 [Candidatus Asgardarchaeia archaeon]
MPLINENKLKEFKKSKTIIIYGCGSSINKLKEHEFERLSCYDSCSFNWFCFSDIPTTYYLVREQANIKKRVHGEENIDNFYSIMNCSYKDSCLILHDLSEHSPHAYDYSLKDNREKFKSQYIVVKDKKLRGNNPGVGLWRKKSIFERGIYHGKNTLTNALHFAVWMRYKKIIFVGFDLYDSRYFWLDDNETRYSVKEKNKDMNSQHQTAKDIVNLIREVKKNRFKLRMYVYNKKSLLANYLGVWDG